MGRGHPCIGKGAGNFPFADIVPILVRRPGGVQTARRSMLVKLDKLRDGKDSIGFFKKGRKGDERCCL
jgi:hypothetical protein